jgi:sugar phosphate isomerase/epimerase
VVVHPPFRWQRDYARNFVEGIASLEMDTGVQFAVENMYPWRAPRRDVQAYVPGWNPVEHEFSNVTIDLSHSATSGDNPVEMAVALGDRLAHVHLADGSGSAKDEHLVPGRGNQPCAEFLEYCAASGFRGSVVIEINTRRSGSRALRQQDLAEALAFARLNLVASADYTVGTDGTVERWTR